LGTFKVWNAVAVLKKTEKIFLVFSGPVGHSLKGVKGKVRFFVSFDLKAKFQTK
jgi:hypothetical protein